MKIVRPFANSARGSDADGSCTCTCSLPAECCAAADCSAAVCSVCRHWMINNCCCCCCCTDDNSPSAVSTDRTLHTHSCTLTQRFLQLSEVLQLVSQYNRGIYWGPDILSSANMFIGKQQTDTTIAFPLLHPYEPRREHLPWPSLMIVTSLTMSLQSINCSISELSQPMLSANWYQQVLISNQSP